MPAKIQQDFEIRQGDFRNLDFHIKDGASPEAAVDISGFTGEWKMAASREASTPTLTKTVSIQDGPNGIARVTLVPNDTVSLRGEFYQEMELLNPSTNPSVTAEGIITIKAALTR